MPHKFLGRKKKSQCSLLMCFSETHSLFCASPQGEKVGSCPQRDDKPTSAVAVASLNVMTKGRVWGGRKQGPRGKREICEPREEMTVRHSGQHNLLEV